MRTELIQKHLSEIKKLESEYRRNLSKIEEIHINNNDIISRIQILINKTT